MKARSQSQGVLLRSPGQDNSRIKDFESSHKQRMEDMLSHIDALKGERLKVQ